MHQRDVYYHIDEDGEKCLHTNLEDATLCGLATAIGESDKEWNDLEFEIFSWDDVVVRRFKNGRPEDGTTTE